MQAFDDHPMRALAALLLALCLGSACAGPTGPEATAKARETRRSGSGGAASEEDVRRARSHHSMGVNHLQDGRVALAIRELRAADQLNPADGWIQLGLAEAYRQKGLLDDSERHLLKGLAYNPDFAELRLTLSALYIQQERFQESLAMSAALVDDPTFPVPWTALTNKGFAEIQLGLLSEARKSLELAVEYHDQYWRAQLNLGILEAMQGRRMEAVDRFEQVIALEPGPLGEAEAYYRTAEIYISLGDRDRAVHQLEAAVSRRPSGSWGKLSEDYLKRLR
jgi:tetratricopeptide (TPR) repeat protein